MFSVCDVFFLCYSVTIHTHIYTCMTQNCFERNTAVLCEGVFCTEVLQDSLAVQWTLQKFKTELKMMCSWIWGKQTRSL